MAATAQPKPIFLWRISSRTYFKVALVLGIFAVIAGVLLSAGHIGLVNNSSMRAANYCNQLRTAILNYQIEYGDMPDDTNNAALIRTLMGNMTPTGHPVVARDNPRGIAFFSARLQDFNDKDELIDPWGTPYQIAIDAKSTIYVRSAGPDKIFGTADDITNH